MTVTLQSWTPPTIWPDTSALNATPPVQVLPSLVIERPSSATFMQTPGPVHIPGVTGEVFTGGSTQLTLTTLVSRVSAMLPDGKPTLDV